MQKIVFHTSDIWSVVYFHFMFPVISRLTSLLTGQSVNVISVCFCNREKLAVALDRKCYQMAQRNPWWMEQTINRADRVANAMLDVDDCTECNIKQITDYIRFTRNVNRI